MPSWQSNSLHLWAHWRQGGSRTTTLAWKYIKVCGYSDRFCKNLNQRSLTPRWPLTPHLLRSYVWLYPRIIVSKSHENTSKYVDTVTLFAKTWTKGHWPLYDLRPHICWGHMCNSTQGSLCPSPIWEYINVCGYSDQFCKLQTKGHWPLDGLWPHICWNYMSDSIQGSLCPSPMKIHQSMWMQWPFLQKIWTKGHWPLDDLWPHICWGHMCDSTQGLLCPSPIVLHQCMWIQWSILLITTYINTTYVHITNMLRTYYIQNQWSHSLRRDKIDSLCSLSAIISFQTKKTPKDSIVKAMDHFCLMFNFKQLINKPTRVTPTSKSAIDLIFVSDPQKVCQSGI